MNRTQRAKIRAAHEALDMAREFKNDALDEKIRSPYDRVRKEERFRSEMDWYKGKQKQIRKLKKYNGFTGIMSEKNYAEMMGC